MFSAIMHAPAFLTKTQLLSQQTVKIEIIVSAKWQQRVVRIGLIRCRVLSLCTLQFAIIWNVFNATLLRRAHALTESQEKTKGIPRLISSV